jgi:RinA family phage transcriptional activator
LSDFQLLLDERLSRETFAMIEKEIEQYHLTLKRIDTRREELLYPHIETDTNIGGGKSNVLSDPTYRKASVLETDVHLHEMVRIVNAINYAWSGLDDDRKRVVKLYYWTRPQTLTWEGIAQEMHIGLRTAKRWRTEFVKQIAKQLGWR